MFYVEKLFAFFLLISPQLTIITTVSFALDFLALIQPYLDGLTVLVGLPIWTFQLSGSLAKTKHVDAKKKPCGSKKHEKQE